ncbi:hypothetical protein [Massilia sp. S19_KUP03_FR1]|uniref:hypothetical protein n=1 Tax=Massilia sp. S19_KUP03_FR1 TaxID=3025503 RepID=UPI002FCD9A77
MTYKILAQLAEPTDLFPGQVLAVAAGVLGTDTLTGPDFRLLFADKAFDLGAPQVMLKAQLQLGQIGALKGWRPAFDIDLALRPAPGDTWVVQGLSALQTLVQHVEPFPGLAIHAGTATLALGLDPWRLTLEGTDDAPAATMALPGMAGIRFDITRLVLDASGVRECSAALVPGNVTIDQLALHVREGTLVVRGGQLEARLQARFELAYFRGASVDLQLAVSADLARDTLTITGLTRIANNVPWSDPSGMLGFDQMHVAVAFSGPAAALATRVSIGGRVTFLPRDLGADADAWFGRLFTGLAVSFDDVQLELADIGLPTFAFSPPEGLHLQAFKVFDMRVPRLAFSKSGVTLLGVTLRFEAGGAVVSGSVASIAINLAGGPALDITLGKPAMAIELAAPGGFKGQASLVQIDGPNVQAVRGHGRISSPALAAVEATFQIGRMRASGKDAWLPALSIMAAQDDVNIALFPGVVATRIELGAGINRMVAGVTGLTLAEGRRKLETGLPDVFSQESWTDAVGDLCVVARIFAESSQTHGDRAMSLYVADLTLLMTLDMQFAAFGRLWLYTSRADARSAPFQQQPSAVGLAMFDGQQPSLRVVAMTRPDGRSSLTNLIPAAQLLGMQMPRAQLAFEAAPAGMALALGPVEVDTTLGPLRVAGSASLVLRSAGGQVYAIARSALSAGFNASTGTVSIGPASLSGSVSANFSASLALMGNFRDGRLLVYGLAHASCTVELALHVQIGFRIRISIGFGHITISWHEDWDFSMRLHVDLDLEAALASDGSIGIDGRARLAVNVLGISAGLTLHIVADGAAVEAGRAVYRNVETDVNNLLGAPA